MMEARQSKVPCEPDLPYVHDMDEAALLAWQAVAAERAGVDAAFQDTLADGSAGPWMQMIPPGMFEMGSLRTEFGHQSSEHPQHTVCLGRPFALGRYTVTVEEFDRFRLDTGWVIRSDLIWSSGRRPVMNIRLKDAQLYADWLSEQTGQRYRLPTEAEWEYACRAGSLTPFHFGASLTCKEAHFNSTFPYEEARQKRRWFLPRCFPLQRAAEVGEKPANTWGLHDMHGNVWEFTVNPWTNSHINANRDGAPAPLHGTQRIVTKGGSYFDSAAQARSAARMTRLRDELDVNLGMRLVRELDLAE
ncbi:MAG: formylglycine-generating enzyme family protein [Gammaproteobacteria bacterium]|jgi:formylglycine-generating enzyme required for sulfatase activity